MRSIRERKGNDASGETRRVDALYHFLYETRIVDVGDRQPVLLYGTYEVPGRETVRVQKEDA